MIDQARGLAQRVPAGMQRQLGTWSARLQVPPGGTETEISDTVAEAIMGSLRK
jgi:hypothetical protein